MTLWGRIHSLSEEDKKRAPELIKEHLKKKQSYLEDFDEELQKAVKNGDLTENEAKKKMKEYQEKNGETREKMAEREFPKQLEALRKEKKKFEELLQESSHYCKEGKLSSEAKKMCEDYEELDEAGKKKEKKNLIRRIDRRNNAAKLCTGYYQEAKNLFEEGEYSKALRLMKRNMRICEHYPDSIMLQDYLEWAETDISNLQWEKEQSDHVQDAREDRDDSIKSGDHEMALETSKTLVNLTKEWLETTFSGSDEEEKPRETKWITPFMKKSSEEAEKTHQALVKIYEHLVQEEQEEEGQLEEEQDLLDQEMSKDVAIQAHMKAA
ncbi:MAG: hypothetical protein U1C97_01410, partial [Candidatus Gracilibacteria bacterium]|nr:hypothetical protein [Candidatus Gracilibacteria bacterium]